MFRSFVTFGILLFGPIQVSSSIVVDKKRKLVAQDFGEIHNQICFQVRDRFLEKSPDSRAEAFRYMTEELLTLCDDDDIECQMKMHQASLKSQFRKSTIRDVEDIIPFNLDDTQLKNTLKDIVSTIDLVETMEVDDVKVTMNNIVEEYKDTEEDEMKHFFVESVASVATASAELWTGVFSDRDDAFYQYYTSSIQEEDRGDRKLQTIDAELILKIIQADLIGAIEAIIFPVLTSVFTGTLEIGLLEVANIALDSFEAFLQNIF